MSSTSRPNPVVRVLDGVKRRISKPSTDQDAEMPEAAETEAGNGFADQEDGGALVASDSEGMSEPLEVIFDKQNHNRRRASRTDDHSQRPHHRKASQCVIHSLLESKLQSGGGNMIPEDMYRPGDGEDSGTQTPDGGTHTQSRLLTKKQLSDMRNGIREMSKKMGRIRLMLDVRNIFLLTKAHDQNLIKKTRDVAEWLLQQRNSEGKTYIVWVEHTMKKSKSFDAASLTAKDSSYESRLKYWTNELCAKKPHQFDICLALGGDGTVLYSAWLFQRVVPPVMSFALGSLGFLTKFDYGEYSSILTRAFKEGITVSLRLRFEATIMRSVPRDDEEGQSSRDMVDELIGDGSDDVNTHRPAGSNNILNDIVIDRGPNPTMSSIEVFGDEEHFTTVQADGICVATPTGSTAYNLAAGGSLCHPDNPVILVTAIAPHTLSFRPIILPDTIVLRIGVPYDARASCWASFDGKERSELKPGDYVTISASRFPFPSVLPLDRRNEDWVDSISRTLNWNNRQRQKAFDTEGEEGQNKGKKEEAQE